MRKSANKIHTFRPSGDHMMPRQGAAAPWYPRPKYEKKREQNSHFSPFRRPDTHPLTLLGYFGNQTTQITHFTNARWDRWAPRFELPVRQSSDEAAPVHTSQ